MRHNVIGSKPVANLNHRSAGRSRTQTRGDRSYTAQEPPTTGSGTVVLLVEINPEHRAGSPAAVLRAMQAPPHPSAADVDELDAAIASGRLPIGTRDLFSK